MLIELYIFYELVIITLFIIAFFIKQELVWGLVAVLSGILMLSSFDVQTYVYVFNSSISAYTPQLLSNNFLYLVWINGIFFVLSVILGLYDVFEKYGTKIAK